MTRRRDSEKRGEGNILGLKILSIFQVPTSVKLEDKAVMVVHWTYNPVVVGLLHIMSKNN
jgi:hypothetical protein